MNQYLFDTGVVSIKGRYLKWKIYNFYSLPLIVGVEISSPQFVYADSRYSLVIWPRGKKGSGAEEWFGICLYKYDARGSKGDVMFSITSSLGDIKTCTVECSENNIFMQERFIEWADFYALRHRITPDGCLNIVCKLFMENHEKVNTSDGTILDMFPSPMNDPPVKYQAGENHSPDVQLVAPSIKFRCPETQMSPFLIPGFKYDFPSTINSFYSASSLENSHEYIPDSAETKTTEFKVPCSGTTPETTFWSILTKGFYQTSKSNSSDQALDPTADSTSESVGHTTTTSAENPLKADCVSANSTTANPNIVSVKSQNSNPGTFSSQTGHSEAECATEVFASNSASSSAARSSHSEEILSSVVFCPKGLQILSQHLKRLYLEGKGYDFIINMAGKEFKVLRSLLKGRSPVFDQLLPGDTDRNTLNTISIDPFDSCDAAVFHDFLLYVYTGQVENLSQKNICGLYSAACMFEMPDLKEECVSFLRLSLSTDSITDIARSIKNESELLEIAVVFFARNMETIMKTDEWKQFMREEPDTAIQYHLQAMKIGYVKTIT